MIVKNQEVIGRMVLRLRAILETDPHLTEGERAFIDMALQNLEPIAQDDIQQTYPPKTS